jgi:trimethylamine--corrinoid protein Co-methyltransferase
MERIDAASKKILEQCGVSVCHSECLDLLERAGCAVDRSTGIARIPRSVVDKAVSACPSCVSLYGRDPDNRIDVGGDNVYFGPGGFAVFAEDLRTGERRYATRQDLIDNLRLSDALPGCEFNHVNVNPSDVEKKRADLHMWADALTFQGKPIMSENSGSRSVEVLVAMGALIRGSVPSFIEKPMICLDICCVSPLKHDPRQVELMMAGARWGLPMSIESGPIGGGTAPVTLAGIASQANAEILSAIVITCAVKPGAPVIYGSWGRHLDMRSGMLSMGGPEFALLKITTAQMGRHYGLPTRGGGVLSDSMISDSQSGYEKMLTTVVPALAGVNYISGMGLNETENCFSAAQLVMDDEIVAVTKRMLRGVEVDEPRLATDLIIATGPGGQFLDSEHTISFFRTELFDPSISNRQSYDRWSDRGKKSTRTLAAEKAEDLLAQPPLNALEAGQAARLHDLAENG